MSAPPGPAPAAVPSFPPIVRVTHWINVVALTIMIMSGLQIFNAHPTLYSGEVLAPEAIVFALPRRAGVGPSGEPRHTMVWFGRTYHVGRFGLTAFPPEVTMGGWLAGARRVHFAAAFLLLLNGLVYLGHLVASDRWRAVLPRLGDWRGVPDSLRAHLRWPPVLSGPGGAYNVLQRIAYAGVVLVALPLVIATGLALSPAWDAILPYWTDLFGGRQGARTWHFVGMAVLVGFTAMHVTLVLLAGWPTLRRMITGRPLPPGGPHETR